MHFEPGTVENCAALIDRETRLFGVNQIGSANYGKYRRAGSFGVRPICSGSTIRQPRRASASTILRRCCAPIARSAVSRKESRGAHFRDDFPTKDKQYGGFNIVVRKGAGGEMQLAREPIPPMREDLQQIIQEMK